MNIDSLEIRTAQESDLVGTWHLFLEMMRPRITAKSPDRDWALRHMRGHLSHPNEIFLLALVDSQPVGAILTRLVTKKRASIFGAYVDPQYRQLGIMRRLGNMIEQSLQVRGISEIEYLIQADNRTGKLVLDALGFRASSITYQKKIP